MRETMAALVVGQMDFIYFFYGLAFLLLGAISFAAAGDGARRGAWMALGLFGYVHGAVEWLDLLALVIGDDPTFAAFRAALLAASFLLLLEFARLEAPRCGAAPPGRWIHVALALPLLLMSVLAGPVTAAALARYLIAFPGAMGAASIFARWAKELDGESRRHAKLAAIGFALYALAAGLVPAPAPFWPASAVNTASFVATTGTPVQLLRGLLAGWIAFSIWSIRQTRLALEISSWRYSRYLRKQLAWIMEAMTAIFVLGLLLTNVLGDIYARNVQAEARSDLGLLVSRFSGETAALSGMDEVLAGSADVVAAAMGGAREAALATLTRHVAAARADFGLILDVSGTSVAATGRAFDAAQGQKGGDFADRRFFREAIAGGSRHCMIYDRASGVRYYVSSPIRDANGVIVGVAALGRSLAPLGAELDRFEHPYFLLDRDGVVAMTNRASSLGRPTWPLPAERAAETERRYGASDAPPLFEREPPLSRWTAREGDRGYLRRPLGGDDDWSIMIATPTHEIFASRVLGIIVTLLVTLMTLIYFVGQERRLHDGIQMDKRARLQELARDLGQKAVTDRLTGLFNRLKFDQELDKEMLRARRFGEPLSLILFDVDNFKAINDAHGHQAGDRALVRLAEETARHIRRTDLLARWGGEEFVLLTPGSDGAEAWQAAEKLRASVERLPFDGFGPMTCSFGVTQYVEGDEMEHILGRADEALYLAKLNGRNRVEIVLKTPSPEERG